MAKTNEQDSFKRIREEEQALQILRLLTHEAFGRRGSNRVIGACLDEIGLYGSPAQIHGILQRLEVQGLLKSKTVEGYGESHFILSLTMKESGWPWVSRRPRALPGRALNRFR